MRCLLLLFLTSLIRLLFIFRFFLLRWLLLLFFICRASWCCWILLVIIIDSHEVFPVLVSRVSVNGDIFDLKVLILLSFYWWFLLFRLRHAANSSENAIQRCDLEVNFRWPESWFLAQLKRLLLFNWLFEPLFQVSDPIKNLLSVSLIDPRFFLSEILSFILKLFKSAMSILNDLGTSFVLFFARF